MYFLFFFVNFGCFSSNSSAANIAMRKVAVSLADSVDLRIILSVLYIMTEVIRSEKAAGSDDFKEIAESFTNELSVYYPFLILLSIFIRNYRLFTFELIFIEFQMHQLAMNYCL